MIISGTTVWKKKWGEGRVRPGWDQPWEWPRPSAPTVCLQADASQDGGVCVKETPKGIPEGQHRGPSFPCAGTRPRQQRDSGPAANRVATNKGRARAMSPEDTQ